MAARRPRDIGTDAERAVVRWLQANGWPHAERRALRGNQDAGDITGTPALCWSVKSGAYAVDPSDLAVADWLHELDDQRERADAAWGVLVTRRRGVGDPGRWWAWMPALAVILLGGGPTGAARPGVTVMGQYPVRMHLAGAVELLRDAGYGDELAEETEAA